MSELRDTNAAPPAWFLEGLRQLESNLKQQVDVVQAQVETLSVDVQFLGGQVARVETAQKDFEARLKKLQEGLEQVRVDSELRALEGLNLPVFRRYGESRSPALSRGASTSMFPRGLASGYAPVTRRGE